MVFGATVASDSTENDHLKSCYASTYKRKLITHWDHQRTGQMPDVQPRTIWWIICTYIYWLIAYLVLWTRRSSYSRSIQVSWHLDVVAFQMFIDTGVFDVFLFPKYTWKCLLVTKNEMFLGWTLNRYRPPCVWSWSEQSSFDPIEDLGKVNLLHFD